MPLEPGLHAAFTHTVTEADTALALGSGDVPVLGTPKVLALVEHATVLAVTGHLMEGMTTVGTRVELDHVLPTLVDVAVRVEAVLEEVDGRRLRFGVRVTDAARAVAVGEVHRTMVTREKFLRAAAIQSESS